MLFKAIGNCALSSRGCDYDTRHQHQGEVTLKLLNKKLTTVYLMLSESL